MKVLLTVFCAAAALFGGGCAAILVNGAGLLSLLPLAILVLNGLILYGLWGAKTPWRPAAYILGLIDLLVAAVVIYIFGSAKIGVSGPDAILYLLPIAFAVKGIISLIYAKRI